MINGIFYLPNSAHSIHATLQKINNQFIINTDKEQFNFIVNKTKISNKLANTVRRFDFSDNSCFECPHQQIIDKWQPNSFLNVFERSWFYAILSSILAFSLLLIIYYQGVPLAANLIANKLPYSTQIVMGEGVLTSLDATIFEPSKLSKSKRIRIQKYFNEIVHNLPIPSAIPLQLYFRGGGTIGANALALPNGSIIITDELLKLAKFQKLPIQGIFAHEIGHIYNRHSLQQAINLTIVPVLLTIMTGDLLDSTQLIASIPIVLLEQGYSRDFEREADRYARELMWRMNKSTVPLAKLFIKLSNLTDEPHKKLNDKSNMDNISILNTHPGIKERIKFFKQSRL